MYTSTTRRRREGEIVSRIIILFFRIAYEIYRYEGKKLDALLAELYTALVIRKLARNGEPVSISAAAREASFSISNMRRYLIALEQQGLLIKVGKGYCIDPEYRGAAVGARHVRTVRRAILSAAAALRKLEHDVQIEHVQIEHR